VSDSLGPSFHSVEIADMLKTLLLLLLLLIPTAIGLMPGGSNVHESYIYKSTTVRSIS
jgi:hypothetical protein